MPEYLAPGVYVEETSFRAKSIEGVSTSTTGFVGPTRFGPTDGEPELLTSFNQFEHIFGGLDPLDFDDIASDNSPNFVAHAVRAFFDNGGSRLYVARTFTPIHAENNTGVASTSIPAAAAINQETLDLANIANADAIKALERARAAFVTMQSADINQQMKDTISALYARIIAASPNADAANPPAAVDVDADDVQTIENKIGAWRDSGAVPDAPNDEQQAVTDALDAATPALTAAVTVRDGDITQQPEDIITALYALIIAASPNADAANPPAAVDVDADAVQTIRDNIEDWRDNSGAVPDNEKQAVTDALDAATPALTAAVNIREANTYLGELATAISAGEVAGKAKPLGDPLQVTDKNSALTGAYQNLISKLGDFVDAERAYKKEGYPNSLGADPADFTQKTTNLVDTATALIDAGDISTEVQEAVVHGILGQRQAEAASEATFYARFPGYAGNMTVTVRSRLSSNVLMMLGTKKVVQQVRDGDLVVIKRAGGASLYRAHDDDGVWEFISGATNVADVKIGDLNASNDEVIPLNVSVEINVPGKFAQPLFWDNLTVSSNEDRVRDSINGVFAKDIENRAQAMETPLVLGRKDDVTPLPDDAALAGHLIGRAIFNLDGNNKVIPLNTEQEYVLKNGNDGNLPVDIAYQGQGDAESTVKSGLKSFEDLEEISIVAAPGYSYGYVYPNIDERIQQINQHIITHCTRMRYRVAVLDSPNNQSLSQVRDYRATMDSKYAAVYYPWVRILDPITNRLLDVPPSGFMTGIYARTDVEVGVHKAPANSVVRGAIGLEVLLNKAQQDILNPLGINCIRYFENRGIRIWGARTISSDPEWKYLNIRRYFAYLERSIDVSTQWAVFEPNGETLWANVRRAVESFLYNEWFSDRLAGEKPERAYFVRCDRSTMTQNDIDNGRMICLIGVAPLYPAEFVIFRIGQWTADSTG